MATQSARIIRYLRVLSEFSMDIRETWDWSVLPGAPFRHRKMAPVRTRTLYRFCLWYGPHRNVRSGRCTYISFCFPAPVLTDPY